MKNPLLYIAVVFLFFFSCKKDQTQAIDFKYGYFPIDTGHYVIYDVDSVTYNDFTTPIITINSVHFYVKECIQSIFIDNSGNPTCWIAGYRSSLPNGPWTTYYTWTSNRYTTIAQKTENNLRYTKLVFPPTLNTSWSGNSYIDCIDTNAYLAGWIYSYLNIDVPLTLTDSSGNLSSDSTLTVLQYADSDLIHKTYSVEKYAKNIGLIYKELDILANDSTDIVNPVIPWPKRANTGFTYKMTAISYKK